MAKHTFKKPEAATERGICQSCFKKPQSKHSATKYRALCYRCHVDRHGMRTSTNNRKPWQAYRKDHCEKCGFIPEHICQLDVDHIDQNQKNNDPENLQTLCANCHRLKTWIERH